MSLQEDQLVLFAQRAHFLHLETFLVQLVINRAIAVIKRQQLVNNVL